jgi:transposase
MPTALLSTHIFFLTAIQQRSFFMVARPKSLHTQLAPTPPLFIGIDVGKQRHVAAFVSASLLKQKRFEQCPVFSFAQSREGLLAFLAQVKGYVSSPCSAAVILESTGHYHRPLAEFLAAEGFRVYVVAIRTKRAVGQNKTDTYDARRLAHSLYAQLALGLQIEEKSQAARELLPATETALQLHGLVRRRYELQQSSTRMKNKLTAICDELFPEMAQVFRDPNAQIALDLRYRWPTPALLAAQSLETLSIVKRTHGPGPAKLLKLLELAKTSIGVTGTARVSTLCFEQAQLIESILLIQNQADALEKKIEDLVINSREGQILLSFGYVGTNHAATIIAMIGNIRNFPRKSDLRKFCGWAPRATQTGTSVDRSDMTPTGSRLLKWTFFLLALTAVGHPTVWETLYQRLVPLKCTYDARTKTYKGKIRVLGRIAGQMVGVIHALLKADAELVDSWPDQQTLPAPVLYDPAVHAGSKPKPAVPTLTNVAESAKMA